MAVRHSTLSITGGHSDATTTDAGFMSVADKVKLDGIETAADKTQNHLGTTATTACAGNDARLSDARAPTGAAGGDLSGTYPDPAVAKVNGTTYPAGGALTTGQVPRVTGAATVAYGALDLANANAVTGSLPTGNQAAQTMGGDCSGTTTACTVAKVNGTTYPAGGALTTGQVPRVTGAATVAYGALDLANANAVTGTLPTGNQASQAMGGDCSGTTASCTVAKVQGRSVSSTAPATYQHLGSADGSTWGPMYPLQPCGSVDVTFPTAAGSADGTAFTVPASPTGGGRFLLMLVLVRVKTAITGSGSVALRVGTTTGGQEIVTDQTVTSANAAGEIPGGQSLATLGASMTAAMGYTAILAAGDAIKLRATTTGTLSAGAASLYVYGCFLP